MDTLVAPLLFRLLFTAAPATEGEMARWVDASVAQPA